MIATYKPIPTPDLSKLSFSVTIPGRMVLPSKMPVSKTTTYAQFAGLGYPTAGDVDAEGANDLGDYVYSHFERAGSGAEFFFVKPVPSGSTNPGEKDYPISSIIVSRAAYTWPAVCLSAPNAYPINRYQQPGGGSTYVERYNWEVQMKEAWRDAHDVRIEEFWSDTKFNITTAARPRPQGYIFDYVLGTFTLPPCLHGLHSYDFSTGSSNYLYPLINSTGTFAGTNFIDWPNEVVLVDEQRPYEGGFLRHKETALKPY